MNDLITIVIPAYNIGDCLAGCLDSVLAQTYTNLEIIIVDDGSKDHTADVIRRYAEKDRRIKPIFKENGGVTSARLRGVAEASGDWIGFVDGDDYIEPDMYARLIRNAQEHHADISHCGYQMVFPSGRVDYYYNTGKLVLQDTVTGLKDLLTGSFIEPGLVNKLYKRHLLIELKNDPAMDPSIRINEDLLMNYCLFKKSKISVHEDGCPYHYMVRAGSAANSRLNVFKLKDPLRVLDILVADTTKWADVHAVVLQRRVYQMIHVATMSCKHQKELIAPYRREIRKRLRAELGDILKGRYCSTKIKTMALWAAVWPASYRWVHVLYGELSGSAHKYDLD